MDQTQLRRSVEALTAEVATLSERADTQQHVIDELEAQRQSLQKQAEGLRKQQEGLHSTRVWLFAAISAIAFVLAVTVGGVFLYRQADANQQQLQDNQHQLELVQQRTSTEILCPLYEVFATSIKVNPPNPNLTPEQAKARREAADTILSGLDKLGCV